MGQKIADWPEPLKLTPWPDWEPHPPPRLTLNQFNLLLHVLIKSHKDPTKPVSFTWSPKTFLGRAPTASESVTLSKRLKGLVTAGYVRRSGRSIEMSPLGKNVLVVNSYWLEKSELNPRAARHARSYLLILDMLHDEAAIAEVKKIARASRNYALVKELDGLAEEARTTRRDALQSIKSDKPDDDA